MTRNVYLTDSKLLLITG